jgi:tight adherence protein B
MGSLDLLVITLALLAILGLSIALYVRRRRIERQLGRRITEARRSEVPEAEPAQAVPTSRWDVRFASALSQSGVEIGLAQWTTIVALSAAVGCLLLGAITADSTAAAFGLVLGVLVPFGVLRLLRARRRRKLQEQLPDALFLIARAMRAGSGLERSLELCADQSVEPLRGELRGTLSHVALGLSVSAALTGMGARLKLEDLDMLVATVQLHQTTGGNLARLVDLVATGARARNQFRTQVLAATALSRISAGFIAAAMPVLLLVYFFTQREFLVAFLRAPVGQAALAVSFFLEVVGTIWLFAILRIRY